MVTPDASDAAASPASPSGEQKKASAVNRAYLIELLLVLAAALLIYSLQVFFFGPMLSLLFDSQGYLWITQSCQSAMRAEHFSDVLRYFLGGCRDDVLRTAIVSQMPGILEIQKSGPLLPGVLLIAYGLAGKTLSMAHWNVGAIAMILCFSSCCVGIWAFARELGGKSAGRIAAILALSYSGFLANAGRILTEIPATSISIFALFGVFLYARHQERKRQEMAISPDQIRNEYKAAAASETGEFPSVEQLSSDRKRHRISKKDLLLALIPGIFTGLLMLGRPTLLPWPVLMSFCLLLIAALSRNRRMVHPAALLSFLLGLALCLAPWAMLRQVLSGAPSIMIERYGPLNLSQGMNLRTDGFDALPSPLVQHPERFDKSMGEVLHSLIAQTSERPAAAADLLLRKPARLVDSPWNDFQIKTFGVPILLQRFEHQLILLAAILGIVLLLEHGRKRPDYVLLLSGLLIGVFMFFHLVSCAFISMSRYYITAMPVAIVAASYFIAYLLKQGSRAWQASLAMIAAPLCSMLLYYLLVPGYGRISDLSCDLGLAQLSLGAAFLMTAVLACGILLPAFTIFKGARSKLLLSTFALITGFCCFVTVSHQFMVSEAVMKLGAIDREQMLASINIPAGEAYQRWYLVIDANDASTHSMTERDRGILSGMRLQFNGRDLNPHWIPLLNIDASMREEAMYLAAFAYSSRKRCSDFRQWICTALPSENIICPGDNQLIFSLKGKDTAHPKVFADFSDSLGKRIHSVSLRNFSWSKGFFADCPGEMRMDEWPNTSENAFDFLTIGGQAARLKARIFLLGVQDNNPSDLMVRSFNIPNQEIGSSADKRMSTFDLPVKSLVSELGNTPTQSLRIRVSGQLKAKNGEATRASICLLEGYQQGDSGNSLSHEFAPLAPQVLEASKDWHEFAFEDIVVPIKTQGENGKALETPIKLQELKLHFLGRPWWEVLDYGVFKGKGTVEFKDLKIELRSQPSLDLSKSNSHWFELDTEFAAK